MSDNDITITVDGKPLKAHKGQMLIEVTDAAGIDIPRFCYHKKLSVAANCRMCLVEVEKAPKPLPACATPVMPDMIVKTQSPLALAAQKGTMEFLLINHPLDCPICDQGGECELQDVAMGYGGGVSQYTEGKRVVMDKYIGPLIATEMTRCIHCTRCVRFGEEVAGLRELGATGRGENVRIGTYIEKSVASEVSGNVIDVCPVGALTARPSRYSARSWELTQAPSVAAHDSVGSNIFVHIDGDQVNRVVPRENESINEVWISDRDRFSYQGIRSEQRLTSPMIRVDGELRETDWETALNRAATILKSVSADKLAVLASANSTLEELYLAQKLGRALGTNNIDHRLNHMDFSGDNFAPVMPWLGMNLDALETLDAALLIGSNIRKDQPIAALRLRKSALAGGHISFLNPRDFPLHFDAASSLVCRADKMTYELLAIAQACKADLSALTDLPANIDVTSAHNAIAEALERGDKSALILGNIAQQHPCATQLRMVAAAIAKATGSVLSILPDRANSCGAWLAGVLPHRSVAGKNKANATVVLPQTTFVESYGTYVNATGMWQSTKGLVSPVGDARPGWKILRVLGELLNLPEFEHHSPEQVTKEVQSLCANVELDNMITASASIRCSRASPEDILLRVGEIPLYATDALVRRAPSLQKTDDAKSQARVSLCAAQARALNISDGDSVKVEQHYAEGSVTNSAQTVLPAHIDESIPQGCVWLPSGINETCQLGAMFMPVEITRLS